MNRQVGSTVIVIRAIGVEFVRRLLRPFVIGGAVAAVVLLGLGGWLTTQNAWWWLLEAVFISGTLVWMALLILVLGILRRVGPPLTKSQKRSVAGFVTKLERVAENLRTPQIVLIYYAVRDTVRPRPGNFIETVSHDSKTLAPDFIRLRRELE